MAKPTTTKPTPKNRLTKMPVQKQPAKQLRTRHKAPNAMPNSPLSPASPLSPIDTPVLSNQSVMNAERVYMFKAARFNPLRIASSPEVLSQQMDSFASGYLRWFALTQEAIFNRDDVIVNCAGKRFGAITRRKIEVVADDNAPEAEAAAQKEVLETFYSSLKVTNAIDLNVIGGTSLLVDQMLLSVGYKYVAHEIIWRPSPKGLQATMNFVPLYFFENRTGKLRFLPHDYAIEGEDLDHDWMITVGRGIMETCAVLYIFKHLPLKDWLIYCERHGMPGVHGKTKGSVGSPQWNAMIEAVKQIAMNFACVTSGDDEIDKLDFSCDGQLPYPPLVESMNRSLASVWRGADLSTISSGKGEGHGASLQGEESDIIEENDARCINETLEMQLSRRVLEYYFGEGCPTCARAKVIIPPRVDIDRELKVLEFMRDSDCQIPKSYLHERFGVPEAKAGEDVLEKAEQPTDIEPITSNTDNTAANQAYAATTRTLITKARRAFAKSTADALKPITDRLEAIIEMPNELILPAVARLETDLPAMLLEINSNPENAKILASALSSGVFNGLIQAIAERES